MTLSSPSLDRRRLIETMILAGGAAAFGVPVWSQSPPPADGDSHRDDWRWLDGYWDVLLRRLKERLAGSDDRAEFRGNSAFCPHTVGPGQLANNNLNLPDVTS